MRFHTPPQPYSRSRDALAVSRLADRENGSTLNTTHLKDFAQDISESVLSVKAKQHAERASELELFDEQFLLYAILALKNRMGLSTFSFDRFKDVPDKREREWGRFGSTSPGGEQMISRDLIDPCHKSTFLPKLTQMGNHLQ